jgi:hypothetical protein
MVPHRLRLSSLSLSLPQDCAKPPSYPPVQRSEGRLMTVLEIFKPASRRAVHVFDDYLKASPVVALRLSPNRVLQLLLAFGTRPLALARSGTQEVKSDLLLRTSRSASSQGAASVRLPPSICSPLQALFRLLLGSGSGSQVIRVSHHLISEPRHLVSKPSRWILLNNG